MGGKGKRWGRREMGEEGWGKRDRGMGKGSEGVGKMREGRGERGEER
jgi:hypothetical protein